MRHGNYLRALAALLFITWFSGGSANSSDSRELILAAQNIYYNIPKEGVTELQCSVTPDWAAMLSEESKSEIKQDNAALKLLNGIHFWVSVSANGKTKLTHQVDANPESTSDMDNFQKAISGIEETMDGFWKTASVFLLTSALPKPDASYQFLEEDGKYVISYREGSYAIVTTIAKDYTISEIKVTSSTLSSSLKPKFTKTDKGFLLDAYDADYKLSSGGPSHVSVQIKYQDVEGLHLPSDLVTQTSGDAGSHTVRLHLADFQIKRR